MKEDENGYTKDQRDCARQNDIVNTVRVGKYEDKDSLAAREEGNRLIVEAKAMYEAFMSEVDRAPNERQFQGDVEQILMKLNSGILLLNLKVNDDPEVMALRAALVREMNVFPNEKKD